MKEKLFLLQDTKSNKEIYIPNDNFEFFIESINLDTGNVSTEKIESYSIHHNLVMVLIKDTKNRFSPFLVSSDHSLIVYDKIQKKYIKQDPISILQTKNRYCLVKEKELIEADDLEMDIDPFTTDAADFTVENNYTFSTSDGVFVQDTMAIFMPLTTEAQQEAAKLMNIRAFSNPYTKSRLVFEKDFKFAICLLTSTPNDRSNYWFHKKAKYKNKETTEGRLALYKPLENKISFDEVNKDDLEINSFISYLSDILTEEEIQAFAQHAVELSRKVLESIAISIDISDLEVSPEVEKQIELLKKDGKEFGKLSKDIQINVLKELSKKDNDIAKMLKCGVLKTQQYQQLVGIKGTVVDTASGELKNIAANFSLGLSPSQYFDAANGARSGVAARAIKTAIPGHLHRKLAFGLASVELDPTIHDCGTTRTIELTIQSDMTKKLLGRYIYYNAKKILLDRSNINSFVGKLVNLRSPIYCKSPKLCTTCYGESYKLLKSNQVGFIAAESLGERMVQQIMKIFHVGGVTEIIYTDPIKQIEENTNKKMNEILKYDSVKHEIYALDNLVITLSKDYYNLRYWKENEFLELEMLMGDMNVNNSDVPIVLDNPILLRTREVDEDSENYYVAFNKNEIVFKNLPETTEVEKTIKQLVAISEGRTHVHDVNHFLIKAYRNLRVLGDVYMVHIEVLISQLFRCGNNLSIPARLCPVWEPVLQPLTKIPYLESWVRSIEFERFKDGLITAITNPDRETKSVLDDLYFL